MQEGGVEGRQVFTTNLQEQPEPIKKPQGSPDILKAENKVTPSDDPSGQIQQERLREILGQLGDQELVENMFANTGVNARVLTEEPQFQKKHGLINIIWDALKNFLVKIFQ